MKKILTLILLGALITPLGCTHFAYQHNKDVAYREAAYKSGDPQVIKAYHNGDVAGMGIDLSQLKVIFRSPGSLGLQALAAGADAAALYFLYEAADGNGDSGDNTSSKSSQTAGRDATAFTNTGNGTQTVTITTSTSTNTGTSGGK